MLFGPRVLYTFAQGWLELNQPQTTEDSLAGVKMKRITVIFQWLVIQAKDRELIDMMDNSIEK